MQHARRLAKARGHKGHSSERRDADASGEDEVLTAPAAKGGGGGKVARAAALQPDAAPRRRARRLALADVRVPWYAIPPSMRMRTMRGNLTSTVHTATTGKRSEWVFEL